MAFKAGNLIIPLGANMQLIALKGLPKVKHGDDLGELIVRAANEQGVSIEEGDIVAVAQCIVSKAEGKVIDLRVVKPSKLAERIASRMGKDPGEVEVILQQSDEVVRLGHVIISRTKHGFICANAGVDHSNVDPGRVAILPDDPDASASRIRDAIRRKLCTEVAVIITDTQGRAFRQGCVGVAVGVAGMKPLLDLKGKRDLYGKELKVTITSPADALAAAAVAVMGETNEGTPVVVIKGATYERGSGSAKELVMPLERDLFR